MNEKLHRIWKAKDVYFVTISKPKWKLTQGSFEGYVSLEEGWVRRNSNKKRPKVDGVQPNGDVTLLKYFYVFISVSQFFFFLYLMLFWCYYKEVKNHIQKAIYASLLFCEWSFFGWLHNRFFKTKSKRV